MSLVAGGLPEPTLGTEAALLCMLRDQHETMWFSHIQDVVVLGGRPTYGGWGRRAKRVQAHGGRPL